MRHRRRQPSQIIIAILILVISAIFSQRENIPMTHRVEPPREGDFSGRVVAVGDGDTIRVMREGQEVKVRLYGIDAPEKRQAYGMAAKRYASSIVFGKIVTVESRGIDRYSRIIGWVKTESGTVLNEEMVRGGMAWWYQEYAPHDSCLAELEARARSEHRGLWSQKKPTPPWEYRRRY